MLRISHGRGDEDDVRTFREMRQKNLGQHEWTEVVRRESHFPAARVLRREHLHEARVIEQANDRQIQRDDLRCRAPYTGKIRQVALYRHRNAQTGTTASGTLGVGLSIQTQGGPRT
jgi:hypothetical protein